MNDLRGDEEMKGDEREAERGEGCLEHFRGLKSEQHLVVFKGVLVGRI